MLPAPISAMKRFAARARRGSGRRRCRAAGPSPSAGAGSPEDEVIPCSNQHIAAGALAADQDPLLPGLAQDRVEPVGAPDGDQVDHAAAARVDHVLGHQVLADVDAVDPQAEERDRARVAVPLAERAVEAARSGRACPRSRSGAGRCAGGCESASSTIASTIASLPSRRLNSWPPRTRMRPPPSRAGTYAAARAANDTGSTGGIGVGAQVAGGQPRLADQRSRAARAGRRAPRAATRPPRPARRRRSAARRRPRPRSRGTSRRAGSCGTPRGGRPRSSGPRSSARGTRARGPGSPRRGSR